MARDITPITKRSRREGYALHPKAQRIMSKKTLPPSAMSRGGRAGKSGLYLMQLREKQKVRRIYGIVEKQFAKLVSEAAKLSGAGVLPGNMLLQLLERRLDNVVYRAGFAISRRAARQLVSHGHFMLNGKRVDIPSIRVKVGDVIEIRPKSKKSGYFSQISDINSNCYQPALSWLSSDLKKISIKIIGLPKREEAEGDISEQLIIEYYSR